MTAAEVYQFAVTVPHTTPVNAPITTALRLPVGNVEWVEWQVPPGPNGVLGFYLASHDAQVVPFASGAANWVVTNDVTERWDLAGAMDSGDWQLVAYNTGTHDHTVTVRFGWSPTAQRIATATVPGIGANGLPDVSLLSA